MYIRFFRKKVIRNILLNFILVLILILSTSTMVLAASNDALSEIRALLQYKYVDPVSADVLNAPTIDETLKRLGDPHTMYFSPEQFQDFLGSIDMRFTGIGTYIEIVPEGVKVVSVVSGSPAEEVGLTPGDVIIRAAGKSLVGLSSEEAVSLLKGVEGSEVQIRVQQGTETRDIRVTRRVITEPTVTGDVLNGNIGYLDLNSFGSDTPKEFATVVNDLRGQNVNSWIVDLRNNGGGYVSSAIDLAGYFIGSDVAVRIQGRTGISYLFEARDYDFTLSQPVIFLTNENSASASELLTAVVKDYHKATIVGATTYGKGTVQSMFPLSNGGVLKMTIDHFYSPLGHEINNVGISPDVEIQQTDSFKVAELMLSPYPVALLKGRTTDYWAEWGEVLKSSSADTAQKENQSGLQNGWVQVTETEKLEQYPLYYPGYRKVGELSEIPLDKKFIVDFSTAVDWNSVNNTSIELINSKTGERTLSTFEPLDLSNVQVVPQVALISDTTYWLVIHPTICDTSGQALQMGGLVLVQTIQGVTELPE